MAKAERKSRFALGLLIYALVFLVITGAGLGVLWQFVDAYEQSRPKTAVNAYLETLTPEQIRDCSKGLLETVDGNIQNEDQAFAVIEAALSEGITAAKNSKNSTSDRMEYKLRSGSQVIGSVTILPGSEERFGFTPWQVTEESFDFSWLMSEPASITVPSEFVVSLNGNVLEEAYITATDIAYPVLEDFYGDFPMPTMVTYTAGNILGDLAFSVSDAAGNPVEITAETDVNTFLPTCTSEEETQLQTLVPEFLTAYVNYTGSANRMAYANLSRLKLLLVKGGELSDRLSAAVGGLLYAQSYGDTILSSTIHGLYRLSDERFLCDVSYVLQTIGHQGAVETEHNIKLVYLLTDSGLKVEAMTHY